MSNSHLVLILAIVIVSIMVNKNTTAHEVCEANGAEASAGIPADVQCRFHTKLSIPDEE